MNKTRQLKWNRSSRAAPEEHFWRVLVINANGEARRILQRLYEQMQPVQDLMTLAQGSVKKSNGLGYTLVGFSVGHSRVPNWNKVYRGSVSRDRELYDRESPDGLAKYIDGQLGR